MPIGTGIVYNTGDLILSQVSGSGTAFLETKIAAATSSLIYFDNTARINSASLNSITVGTSSFVSGSTSIITNLTASNISSSGNILTSQFTSSGVSINNGSLRLSGSNGYIQMYPINNGIPTNVTSSFIYVSGSTNDIYFTQNNGINNNTTRLKWLESNLYTGLLYGGVLSSTPGSNTFNITAGQGIIVQMNASTASAPSTAIKQISWGDYTNQPITYSGSAKITYVGLDALGQVIQQTVAWGTTNVDQWDDEIFLGVVLHLSGSVSTGVFNSPQVSYANFQKSDDFFRAFGPLKLSGHVLQPSGSSPTLSIKKSGGTSYRDGANYVIDANHPSTVVENDANTSKIYRYYLSGSTPIIDTGVNNAGYTTIDNDKYVNTSTGVLTTVGNSNWSIQRVFWVPNSPTNAFIVYYGNASYSTLLDAVNARDSEPFTEAANTALNSIFVGYIIIEGGTNRDLLNSSHCNIIQGGLFRNVGGIGTSGTTPVSTALSALSDVALTSLNDGDLLVYNGGQWNNKKTLEGNYIISGSLNVTSGITGNLIGTSSWATNAQSASYVSGSVGILTNLTASNISASGRIVASSFTGSFSGSIGTAVSASYALTSSYISPSGNAFVQGGNSFGTTALLGTNDAQSLALETNGTTRMSINSNGNVAINTSTSGFYRLNILDTHASSEGSSSLFIQTNQNQVSANSSNDSGITNLYYVNAYTSSTVIQNQAAFNQLYINASGSLSGSYRASRNAINLSNTASLHSGGNIINTYCTNQVNPNIPSFSIPNWVAGTSTYVDLITGNTTGSITNLYNHYINSPFPSAGAGGITVTNSYGVYIAKQKTTNIVTNGWGIYQEDSNDINYFNGNVGIGTSSPNLKLHIRDTNNAGGVALRIQNNSTNAAASSSIFFTTTTADTYNSAEIRQDRSAGSNLSFLTDNTSRLYISASGNVGIGTTSPTSRLTVSGSIESLTDNGGEGGQLILRGNTYRYNIDNFNGQALRFFREDDATTANGAVLMYISASGNVGIGTTSPNSALDVVGSIYLSGDIRNNWASKFFNVAQFPNNASTSPTYYMGLESDSSNRILYINNKNNDGSATDPNGGIIFRTGATPTSRMIVSYSGNVGIGTTNPNGRLHVTGSDSSYAFAVAGNTKGVRFNINSLGTYIQGVDNTLAASYQSLILGGSDLYFQTNGVTNAMYINSSGNVGIGTTSPSSLLDVAAAGTARISVTNTSAGRSGSFGIDSNGVYIQNSNNGDYFDLKNASGVARFRVVYDNNTFINTTHTSVGSLTASGSKLSVFGNLSVGSTYGSTAAPSNGAIFQGSVGVGTSSPDSALHVYSTSFEPAVRITSTSGSVKTYGLIVNPYWATGSFHIYDYTTDNSRLQISTTGNVGIGVGANTPANKLDLVGDLRIRSAGAALILDTTTTSDGRMEYKYNGTRKAFIGVDSDNLQISADSGNYLQFRTNGGQRMIITNGGGVGIGTTNPYYAFDLYTNTIADALMSIRTSGSANARIYFDAANGDLTGGDYCYLGQDKTTLNFVINTDGSAGNIYLQPKAGTNNGILYVSGSTRLGLVSTNTHQFTGSVSMSEGLTLTNLTASNVSASNSIITSNITASNAIIRGNLTVTGSIFASLFSASNVYITSSTLTVTDNILTLNALTPYQRYAGIEMYDSGSGNVSSFLWDGQGDYFFISGSGVNGKIITGPDGQTDLTSNYIPKATAGYKLGNSVIYDDGTNVGIGTTVPGSKLQINDNTPTLTLRANNGGVSRKAYIDFYTTFFNYPSDVGARRTSTIVTGFADGTYGTWGTEFLSFNVGSGSANDAALLPIERMRIDGSGNVGIGVTSPSGRLHITASATNGQSLVYLSKGSGSISQNYINAVDQSGNLNYRVQSDINGHLSEVLYQTGTGYVSFNTFWSSWINNNNYTQGGLGIGTNSQTHGYGLTIAKPATSGSLYVSGSSVFTGSVNVSGSVTFSGPIIYDNAVLLDYGSTTTPVVSTNYAVLQNLTGSYNAAFFDYFASSGSNFRAGTVIAGWSGSSVNYTEYATTDTGNTNQLSMSVDLSGSFIRLLTRVSTTTNWNIKSSGRYL